VNNTFIVCVFQRNGKTYVSKKGNNFKTINNEDIIENQNSINNYLYTLNPRFIIIDNDTPLINDWINNGMTSIKSNDNIIVFSPNQ